ncbi:MAG: hypothetical protein AB1491_05260 [Thermodesulfobacteriota bacterium]
MPKRSSPTPASPGEAPGCRGDLWLITLLSAAIFTFAHLSGLANPYVINDDARQQIYWMQAWSDPQLFPRDLLTDYARHYVPWGVKGIYWLASFAVDPVYFSKVLPGLLLVFLSLCLYRIGVALKDRALGWTAVSVFWLMPFFLGDLSGGLARAFAAPLLAWFWLGWLENRPGVMALALLLQALCIPYIFPVAAGAAAMAWAAPRLGFGGEPPPFPATRAHWLLLALGAGLVLFFNISLTTAGFGPLVSRAEMAGRPEFMSQGRYPLIPVTSVFLELILPWERIPPFSEGGIVVGVLVLIGLLSVAVYGTQRVNWAGFKPRLKSAVYLGLASLLFYFLARLLLLRLFIPDRYLFYTLNLFYAVGLAVCLRAAVQGHRWPRGLAHLALVLVVVLSGLRLKGVELYDYSAYRPLFTTLAQTPKDAVVAGHPNLMDNIPTFARRRAFATFELAHPWSRGYWEKMRPRLEELFTAYYAADPEVVRDFCRRHGISFLVVDDRHFAPDFLQGGRFYVPDLTPLAAHRQRSLAEKIRGPFFAPFAEQIQNLTRGRRHFALLSREDFPGQEIDAHLRLVDMRPQEQQPSLKSRQ